MMRRAIRRVTRVVSAHRGLGRTRATNFMLTNSVNQRLNLAVNSLLLLLHSLTNDLVRHLHLHNGLVMGLLNLNTSLLRFHADDNGIKYNVNMNEDHRTRTRGADRNYHDDTTYRIFIHIYYTRMTSFPMAGNGN